jgi:hypothetical protein
MFTMADPDSDQDPAAPPNELEAEAPLVEIDWVGQQLRSMYATVVAEPLPDSLHALLAALESEPGS